MPRYVVTTAPLGLIDARHPGFCIAVDPAAPHGVWWWEPGRTGCSSRSTGPDVFPAQGATVVTGADQAVIEVRFRLQLHVGPDKEVRLVLRDGRMAIGDSDVSVGTERRPDLVLTESAPFR